jgi:hypothetical protein
MEPKSRPILFSGAMVRAILDGSKTQTRRIMKCPNGHPYPDEWALHGRPVSTVEGWVWTYGLDENDHPIDYGLKCPYGKHGDRLTVKEDFLVETPGDLHYETDGLRLSEWTPSMIERAVIHYRATNQIESLGKWRGPLFMPRWASRIELEIVSVRVERLQAISNEDAVAEGVHNGSDHPVCLADCLTAYARYRNLWESINGKGSWALNPWVWVVEFNRVES